MRTTTSTSATPRPDRHRTWIAALGLSSLALLAACSTGSPADAHDSDGHGMPDSTHMTGTPGMDGHPMDRQNAGTGLLATEDGYTLKTSNAALTVGTQTLQFQVLDSRGRPQTDYVEEQTQRLHLYVVRLDLTGYQHLHPTLRHGSWYVDVSIATPGPYRIYTDFVAQDSSGGEHPLVLSTLLTAPGSYHPVPLPAASRTVTVNGLTATLTGSLTVGAERRVSFRLTRPGQPVRDLQPYLGAFAHLTALHAGDGAYRHLHPMSNAMGGHGGPDLGFSVDLPAAGSWRLFLQVQRAGRLLLLPITVSAG